MTSCHGNAFRVTGPSWKNSELWCFIDVSQNELLNKHPSCRCFETRWRSYGVTVMNHLDFAGHAISFKVTGDLARYPSCSGGKNAVFHTRGFMNLSMVWWYMKCLRTHVENDTAINHLLTSGRIIWTGWLLCMHLSGPSFRFCFVPVYRLFLSI